MSPEKAWMLLVGSLLLVGTLGSGEAGPVPEEPKCRPTVPEVGRDAAIAEIEKLGGSYRCDEGGLDGPIMRVTLSSTQVTDDAVKEFRKTLPNCRVGCDGPT